MREIYEANKFSLFILDLMPQYICHYIFIDVRASLKLPLWAARKLKASSWALVIGITSKLIRGHENQLTGLDHSRSWVIYDQAPF